MDKRYKDQTIHMLQSFNKTARITFAKSKSPQNLPKQIQGQTGTTWDAKHLNSFLTKSFYSNIGGNSLRSKNSQPKSQSPLQSNDYFFKTTKDNKNASRLGYTFINPLVSIVPISKRKQQMLNEFLRSQPVQIQQSKKEIGNLVKFRITDPLTLRHVPQSEKVTGFEIQRRKRLLQKRHPHGVVGADHPQNPQSQNYTDRSSSIRIRKQPNSNKHYLIDADWKVKRRSVEYEKPEYGFMMNINIQRKFANDNIHGYDIVNNRVQSQIIRSD